MRRLTVLLVVALIASLFAASNSFAAEEQKISVLVDGEAVVFTTEPFLENGTTLVPFRTIFTKLGLTIGWDQATKTATGKKEGLSIELQIGSKTALVNGEKKPLTVAPKVVNGETFIPLRFVSENAQKEVSWDGISKEVYIADADLQIHNLFEKHLEYSAEENLAGVMSTVDPSSAGYAQTEMQLSQIYPVYDLHYEATIEILDLQEESAIVLTTITTTKVSGPDFEDNMVVATNELIKVNGQWKINATTPYYMDFLKDDLLVEGDVSISQAEQDAILDVIEQSRQNGENEDWEAELLLYTNDYPELQQAMEQSQQLSAIYDFTYEVSNQSFLEASEDTAVVYYETLMEKTSGPEFRDFNAGAIVTFKKIDGKWLFALTDIVFIDYNFDAPTEEVQ